MIAGMDYLRQCGRNDFKDVAPGRNPSFFMIEADTGSSSLSKWPVSHELLYHSVLLKNTLETIAYTEDIIPHLSVLVGQG